jgi:SAM-dependent methyltransferase
VTHASLLFDELASAGAPHVGAAAASYERRHAFDPRPDIERLREHGLDRSSVLVDLGAGGGRFALAAARYAGRVVAVDISPDMRRAFESRRRWLRGRRIEYVSAGFLSYEHEGEPPDFVYSRNALHHLPDIWKVVALQRINAMLRPRGVLLLRTLTFECEPAGAIDGIERHLADCPTDPAKGFTREESEAMVNTKTYSWLLETMLERAGFEIERRRIGAGLYAEHLCVKR